MTNYVSDVQYIYDKCCVCESIFEKTKMQRCENLNEWICKPCEDHKLTLQFVTNTLRNTKYDFL